MKCLSVETTKNSNLDILFRLLVLLPLRAEAESWLKGKEKKGWGEISNRTGSMAQRISTTLPRYHDGKKKNIR